MIRHILRVIWNERKSNVLIFIEFIIIFCVLWFCTDYLYYIGSRYFETEGYDISNTYSINMRKVADGENSTEERHTYAMMLKDRLEKYPGVETVSFSISAIPFGWSTTTSSFMFNNDSAEYIALRKTVTPEYFKVFRIGLTSGRSFTAEDMVNQNRAMISPDRYGFFRDEEDRTLPANEIRTLKFDFDSPDELTVIGMIEKQKKSTFEPFQSVVFMPFKSENYDCANNEIVVRVRPDADKGFAERFAREMHDQLSMGPYIFTTITPLTERRENDYDNKVGDSIKSVLAITAFLIINIFLGIIGTFWSRTESRRSEIGLRLALGSSRLKVQGQMFVETMIMLVIASLIGVYICINLGQSDLLQAVGIPLADYKQAGFGSWHPFLNYGITLLSLALIAGFAVWYPARTASKVQPAESLRAE